ncbi:MAG: hypothetical protein AB7G06_03150 [Bdellovibrionales bacterium]
MTGNLTLVRTERDGSRLYKAAGGQFVLVPKGHVLYGTRVDTRRRAAKPAAPQPAAKSGKPKKPSATATRAARTPPSKPRRQVQSSPLPKPKARSKPTFTANAASATAPKKISPRKKEHWFVSTLLAPWRVGKFLYKPRSWLPWKMNLGSVAFNIALAGGAATAWDAASYYAADADWRYEHAQVLADMNHNAGVDAAAGPLTTLGTLPAEDARYSHRNMATSLNALFAVARDMFPNDRNAQVDFVRYNVASAIIESSFNPDPEDRDTVAGVGQFTAGTHRLALRTMARSGYEPAARLLQRASYTQTGGNTDIRTSLRPTQIGDWQVAAGPASSFIAKEGLRRQLGAQLNQRLTADERSYLRQEFGDNYWMALQYLYDQQGGERFFGGRNRASWLNYLRRSIALHRSGDAARNSRDYQEFRARYAHYTASEPEQTFYGNRARGIRGNRSVYGAWADGNYTRFDDPLDVAQNVMQRFDTRIGDDQRLADVVVDLFQADLMHRVGFEVDDRGNSYLVALDREGAELSRREIPEIEPRPVMPPSARFTRMLAGRSVS